MLSTYNEQGFAVAPGLVTAAELALITGEAERLAASDCPGRVVEADGQTVRAVQGLHLISDLFSRLTRLPRFVSAAEQIVDSQVYVHQFKINFKRAFHGEVWPWHQDYPFWAWEDGMPSPRVTNVGILLDDFTPSNGPLLLIPGSHRVGVLEGPREPAESPRVERRGPYRDGPAWLSGFVARLKFTVDEKIVTRLARDRGIVPVVAPAGTCLFFDSCLAHASAQNMSPFDRRLLIITYNSVDNIPRPAGEPRPEFIAARDHRPLIALDRDSLTDGPT